MGEDFVGRQREIAEICETIAHGSWVSLVGERRVGKSSILNALQFEPSPLGPYGLAEYQFALLDCQSLAKASEDQVIESLLMRMAGDDLDAASLPPTRKSLERVVFADYSASSGRHIVIILDEIDALARNKNIPQSFFGFLRSWSQSNRIALVTASKEGSMESLLWNDDLGSPFWNIFRPVYVGPFTEGESLALIHVPAQSQGVDFSKAEEQWILTCGGHQPFFLQIACDYLFQAKIDGLDGAAALMHAERGFRREAMPHLDYLRRGLSNRERTALVKYVTAKESPQGRVLDQLLMKGVLVDDSLGFRIFSSALADVLTDRDLEPANPSLLGRIANFLLNGD